MTTTTGDDTGIRTGAGRAGGAGGGAGGGSADSALFARARAAGVGVGQAYAAQVAVVAELEACGAAVAAGYKSTSRLCEDLWRLDPAAARRLIRHAAMLTDRVSLSGEPLPAVLPDTAAGVRAGLIGPEQVEIVDAAMSKVRDIPGLPVDDEQAAEALLAESAAVLAPCGLCAIAARLVDTLDPDGAAPPDPETPEHELLISRRRRDGATRLHGLVHGIDGETVFEAVDALATKAGPDDTRSLSQRRAEALVELAAQALSPSGIAARTPCCPDHDPTDRTSNNGSNNDIHADSGSHDGSDADTHNDADAQDEDLFHLDNDDSDAGHDDAGHDEGDTDHGDRGPDQGDPDDHADSDHADSDHADSDQPADTDTDADSNASGNTGSGTDGDSDGSDGSGSGTERVRSGPEQGRFPEALRGPTKPDQCATIPVRGRALLTVTMNLEDLTERVGHGLLDSGLAVSPETVRRVACDAGIVPLLLGSRSEPLDIGRLAYATPDGMRRALHHRDRGCTFPGCTRRPRRCHAHHVTHWLDLGDTALDNMCLLCRYHHYLVHHSGWTVTMHSGRPWFTPPAWLDPTRTPRPGGVDTTLAG